MGNLWFATGPKMNAIERAAGGYPLGVYPIIPTGVGFSTDPNFIEPNIYDGRLGTIWRAGTTGGGQLRVDLQMLANGNMESGFTAGTPNAWTKVGAGTVADETTIKHGGGHSCKITPPASNITQIQQINAFGHFRSNERYFVSAWIEVATVGAGNQADIYIQNTITGRWLQSDGTWAVAQNPFLSTTGNGSFQQISGSFLNETISPFEASQGPFQQAFLVILNARGGISPSAIYFDDAVLVPGINHASLHGTNLLPISSGQAVTFESSDDASSWTVRSSNPQPVTWPSMYWLDQATIYYAQFWRVFFNISPFYQGNLYVGEFVLAQMVKALRNPNYPIRISLGEIQQRQTGVVGTQWVYAQTSQPRRMLTLGVYSPRGTWPSAQYKQLRDELIMRSRNGLYPVLVVPQDTDNEVCIYGRLPDTTDFSNAFLSVTEMQTLSVVEDGMPAVYS